MHQHIQAGPLPRRDRDHRHMPQHLRQAVKIDLHPPLFHNVHHVESHDHWLFKLKKLQRQIEVSLQRGGVHHVNEDIHLIFLDAFSRDALLDGVGGQTIDARQVDDPDGLSLVAGSSLHPLHGHAGPVGHFQLCAGKRVKKRRFSAVGVSNEADADGLCVPEP